MPRDPQIQRDPERARTKWRRRQLWALVFTVAALLGALLGGGDEAVVAVIVVGGFAVQAILADFAGAAWLQRTIRRLLG